MKKNDMTNTDNKMERVGIWIRFSKEGLFFGEAPEVYEAKAEYYAESKGWHVVRRYRCRCSDKAVFAHPQTSKMLYDVKFGHIQGLIFRDLTWLGWNIKEFIKLKKFFKEHDAHLISLPELIDTGNSTGRLLFHVPTSLAECEREFVEEIRNPDWN